MDRILPYLLLIARVSARALDRHPPDVRLVELRLPPFAGIGNRRSLPFVATGAVLQQIR